MLDLNDPNAEVLLSEACKRFNIRSSNLILVSNSFNTVYKYSVFFKTYFLKLIPSSYKDFDQITEIACWVKYLSQNGINAPEYCNSINNKIVEKINFGDGYYSVILVEKVKGRKITKKDWNEKLFLSLGENTGCLHALTKKFNTSLNKKSNNTFTGIQLNERFKYLPLNESTEKIRSKYNQAIKILESLEINDDSFGLVHNDLARGNFLLRKNDLGVIDFEDASCNFFISDIAAQI